MNLEYLMIPQEPLPASKFRRTIQNIIKPALLEANIPLEVPLARPDSTITNTIDSNFPSSIVVTHDECTHARSNTLWASVFESCVELHQEADTRIGTLINSEGDTTTIASRIDRIYCYLFLNVIFF